MVVYPEHFYLQKQLWYGVKKVSAIFLWGDTWTLMALQHLHVNACV